MERKINLCSLNHLSKALLITIMILVIIDLTKLIPTSLGILELNTGGIGRLRLTTIYQKDINNQKKAA